MIHLHEFPLSPVGKYFYRIMKIIFATQKSSLIVLELRTPIIVIVGYGANR